MSSQITLTLPANVRTSVGGEQNTEGSADISDVSSAPATMPHALVSPAAAAPMMSATSPSITGGRHSPVATSADGKFILQYLGAAMMDSRCTYTPQMMPWIIAEIMRFSEPLQVKNKNKLYISILLRIKY